MNEEQPNDSHPGDEKAYRIAYLVAGFIRKNLTAAEETELDDWVNAGTDNQLLFEKLIDEKTIEGGAAFRRSIDTGAALKKVKGKKRVPLMWMYAAAACVVAVVIIGFLLIGNLKGFYKDSTIVAKTIDIAPGKDRATLTLSDGTVVLLDSLKTGKLPVHGHEIITKLDSGQLAYQTVHTLVSHVDLDWNTLTVPAGGQYKLVLPDGSRVWLNASSSLRYPVVFGGARRTVELTGEGYFEVTKDPAFPFEVKANGTTVQVLGTHFNVNAYADEPVVKVVLAEGSVKLNQSVVLVPGEGGTVEKNGTIKKSAADVEAVLAWKNGRFMFKEMPVDVLMRQVARWYDAEIVYASAVNDHFNADISRSVPVSKLLHLLEGTGRVHFKIEDKKITVMR